MAKDQPAAGINLLPCPFCGNERIVRYTTSEGELVGCDNCENDMVRGTMEEAIVAWNTRSDITTDRAVDDEAKAQNCPDRIWLHELIEDGFVEHEWAKTPSPAPYHRSVRYYRGDIAGGMIEVARTELIKRALEIVKEQEIATGKNYSHIIAALEDG